jgi:hypothetical protein
MILWKANKYENMMLKRVIKIFMEKIIILTQAYEFQRNAIKSFGVCR